MAQPRSLSNGEQTVSAVQPPRRTLMVDVFVWWLGRRSTHVRKRILRDRNAAIDTWFQPREQWPYRFGSATTQPRQFRFDNGLATLLVLFNEGVMLGRRYKESRITRANTGREGCPKDGTWKSFVYPVKSAGSGSESRRTGTVLPRG